MSIKDFAAKSVHRYVSKFSEIVEQYNGRNLTVQTDRLFAFQGILNAIKAIDPKKDHFWALTTWEFELELDWSDASKYSSKGELDPVAGGMFPSWSWLSYPASVAIGYNDPKVVCFRFFYDPVTAFLDCKRVSPMKYEPMPGAPEINWALVDMSMIKMWRQFPEVMFSPDRQIVFWADVVRLGVNWNQEHDFYNARLLTGYDESLLVDRPTLKQECLLLSWSEKLNKTKTEYDFLSISPFRREPRMRSIWILDWKNSIATRAGHGIIRSSVWNSLTKDWRVIIVE